MSADSRFYTRRALPRRIRDPIKRTFLQHEKRFPKRRRNDRLTLRFDFGKIAVIRLLTDQREERDEKGSRARARKEETDRHKTRPTEFFVRTVSFQLTFPRPKRVATAVCIYIYMYVYSLSRCLADNCAAATRPS